MSRDASALWSQSLGAWLARDALLLALFLALFELLRRWHAASSGAASATTLGVGACVLAYATCYLAHEWGHDLGARALGASPLRGSIRGVLLARFDVAAHTRAQFLGLAYGGQLGTIAAAAAIVAGFQPELGHRAAALGAIAFVVQSLAVDQATLGPVLRGSDVASALRAATRPRVLLGRTAVAWSALSAVLVAVHVWGGGLP